MDHRTRSWTEPRDGWHHRMEHELVVVGFPDAIGDCQQRFKIGSSSLLVKPVFGN